MPPDRMISEIVRRIPSRGMGLAIPIPMGGGGGGGTAASEAGAEAGTGDAASGEGEGMVAATDKAVNADRQATVASSGMMDSDDGALDSESSSTLFGDAAPKDALPTSSSMENTSSTYQQDDFLSKDIAYRYEELARRTSTKSTCTIIFL
jgi:hypothetical protein